MNVTDAAIGWGLILAMALACYFGIPLLLRPLVRSILASREEARLRRERIQDELDDQLRDEMWAFLEQEAREKEAREKEGGAP